jgi:hypothetical protein
LRRLQHKWVNRLKAKNRTKKLQAFYDYVAKKYNAIVMDFEREYEETLKQQVVLCKLRFFSSGSGSGSGSFTVLNSGSGSGCFTYVNSGPDSGCFISISGCLVTG